MKQGRATALTTAVIIWTQSSKIRKEVFRAEWICAWIFEVNFEASEILCEKFVKLKTIGEAKKIATRGPHPNTHKTRSLLANFVAAAPKRVHVLQNLCWQSSQQEALVLDFYTARLDLFLSVQRSSGALNSLIVRNNGRNTPQFFERCCQLVGIRTKWCPATSWWLHLC